MLRQSLGLDQTADRDLLCLYFFGDQKADGSWGIAPDDYPGDVSTTVEAYLALRLLGIPAEDKAMLKARDFILSVGGIAKVRIFTRIALATFGLFPWNAIPELPAELILMPSFATINIYRLSSWARSTIVPLLVLCHHRPLYSLPNGMTRENTFLDELWCNPTEKMVPYTEPLQRLWKTDIIAFVFTAVDKALCLAGGLRKFPLRGYARRKCVDWILEHQEKAGDWAGIYPPMHFGILALLLEGYELTDSRIVRALEAIERFAWQDEAGKRIQSCVSPVWDTVLTIVGLCDADLPSDHNHLVRAVEWVKVRQLLDTKGDWQIYRPRIVGGGFSFEYFNGWYPDVDDTAAAILAFLKQNPKGANSPWVVKAVEWSVGMQNNDGGFAAFDTENDRLFLNKIPFSDMNSLCDPSTADVTGRVLEAFGLFIQRSEKRYLPMGLLQNIRVACERGITYLASIQELSGAWYGRWGSNYIYGTSNAVCGLAYFSTELRVRNMIQAAVDWVKQVQNDDGGWGEDLVTYARPEEAGKGNSTASQTAWGLMALLAHLGPEDNSIQKGITYLIRTQSYEKGSGASWPEKAYTGTGFPRFFYIGYQLYSHYFPLMALGRFVKKGGRLVAESKPPLSRDLSYSDSDGLLPVKPLS